MVRVDAAHGAEPVLGGVSAELVKPENISTFHDSNPVQRNRGDYSALSTAYRTIAAARTGNPMREGKLKDHRTAVARSSMLQLDLDATYGSGHAIYPFESTSPNALPSGSV
jgi:hypothetical protein